MKCDLKIYDSTLRDGAQTQGIGFGINDKIRITEILDDLNNINPNIVSECNGIFLLRSSSCKKICPYILYVSLFVIANLSLIFPTLVLVKPKSGITIVL